MNCQEVIELMQRHMDGDLDQHETSLMTDHVGRCPECAAMFDRLQRLNDNLSQLPRVEPKFSIVDVLLPRLDQLEAERLNAAAEAVREAQVIAPPVRSDRPDRRWMRGLSGVVALGVVALVVLFSREGAFSGGSNNNFDSAAALDARSLKTSQAPAASAGSSLEGSLPQVQGVSGEQPAETYNLKDQYGNDSFVAGGESSAQGGGASAFSGSGASEGSASADSAVPSSTEKISVAAKGNEAEKSIQPPNAGVRAMTPEEASIASTSAVPAAMLLSPDGRWRAVAVAGSGTVQVYDTQHDDALVFESEPREGEIGHLAWDSDGKQLQYVWTDSQGKETELAFDVETKSEIQR